jgi:hypothetical protein
MPASASPPPALATSPTASRSRLPSARTLAAAVVLLAVAAPILLKRLLRGPLPPPHLLGHPLLYEPGLVPPEVADALLERAKALRDFPTNVNDLSFYKTRHEHIGEAIPSVNGSCAHPFLTPSIDRTLCVLPGRIDVGRAYVLSGGVEGLKESHPLLVTRVQSFGRYHFDLSSIPETAQLFSTPSFQRLAASVCPPHARVLDPFQFNFIAQVPGQTVAAHIDAPYFFGADRFHVPQWLLAVMVFSGLFQDRFVDQVQVVAYIHRWEEEGEDKEGAGRAGQFVYWDDASGVPKSVPPSPLSGSGVDGSKVVHAAAVYRPDVRPPILDKSKPNVLRFVPDDSSKGEDGGQGEGDSQVGAGGGTEGSWRLFSGDDLVRAYNTSDLRFSVVYRARCFESEERKAAFAAQRRGDEREGGDMLPLDVILDTLKDDLVRRGRAGAGSRAQLDALPRLDLALRLLDEYIRYPRSHTAAVPVNYCAAKLVLPAWAGRLLDLVCD